MNGITFGNFHSYDNLELILSSKTIGSPKIKTETVNVPGADGVLDYTEFFGEPKYDNRSLKFDFQSIEPWSEQLAQDSTVKNALHGRKLHITLDDDPDFYYIGRISVGDWANNKNVGKVTITCDCEPWKYKNDVTTVSQAIVTSGTVTLSNLRRSVSPSISTTAAITVAWTGGSASLSAGDDQIVPELILKQGDTALTITGTATVTFEYQEGGL